MTDMESPKKNNDCYFYYYSTCSKGDSCGFRHEPSALGCETMCSFWKEGKCLNIHCNFRHMELRKNRKVIPCYWEAQPGGCLKPHCPFMHQTDPPVSSNDGKINKSEPSALLPENCTQAGNYSSSVDSIVVNFEEESDNETSPTMFPVPVASKVKTLEEIKLEKIAAACAAYYSYPDEEMPEYSSSHQQTPTLSNDDLRQRILQKVKAKDNSQEQKLSRKQLAYILGDSSLSKKKRADSDPSDKYPPQKKRKTLPTTEVENKEIKIKTLQEIRAERQRETKTNQQETKTNEIDDSEVTSTSNEDNEQRKVEIKPLRRLNLRKIIVNKPAPEAISENVESTSKNIENIESDDKPPKLEKSLSNKTVEESLLLLDDDMDEEENNDFNLSVKSEDDLFKEIDHLLKN
ncbi:unnamed protein product [Ceutorhynchus assimilis]|uniref:C3H1-type domain-containing protein n=1 Tax=Ceutorhynchus assimilis TaxID=467358 RepID=A0A9N9QE01_9CUCU|nr:unnamed protein product [Ceutorhynchus assimilis]